MKRAEHKVGETIEYGEDTLKITKQIGNNFNPCDQCYFEKQSCWLFDIEDCLRVVRDDNTDIIFVKVEKGEA